jgi:hypothetical protein
MRFRIFFYAAALASLVLGHGLASAQVVLTSSATSITYPATVTLTVTVPAGTATAGTALPVTVTDGTTTLISSTVTCCSAATLTFSNIALKAGAHTLTASYVPDPTTPVPIVSSPVTITVAQAKPTISWATPASIVSGTALSSTQLDATANVPGTFSYSPAAGTVLTTGTHALTATFTPTDSVDYLSAQASVTINVAQATPTISWATPASIVSGTALSSTQLDATANVPGTFSYNPPAGTVLATGTHTLAVTFTPTDSVDYSSAQASVTINVTVLPVISLQGPLTSSSAQQPTVTFQASALSSQTTVTFTLTFAASTSPAVDDPAIQFSTGGRTLTATIPANSTFSKTIALQTGTVAGTITVKATLTANGSDVTPSSLVPVAIKVSPAVPAITSVTLTRGTNSIQVAMVGFSNTREVVQAEFRFGAAQGSTLQTTDLIVSASQLFSGWFQSSASAASGSSFLYTQPFTLGGDSASIAFVTVTITNTQGASASATAQ